MILLVDTLHCHALRRNTGHGQDQTFRVCPAHLTHLLGKVAFALHLDRSVPKVRLELFDVVLAKLLLGISSRNGGWDDHVVSSLPINGSGNTLLVGSLQGVDNPEDFGTVTASRGWVPVARTVSTIICDCARGGQKYIMVNLIFF